MASVPFIVLIYDGPLVCGFNVAIRGLIGLVGVNISDFFIMNLARRLTQSVMEYWA